MIKVKMKNIIDIIRNGLQKLRVETGRIKK